MTSFSRYFRHLLPPHPQARGMCQGSTIILAICALCGAATAVAALIAHLA